MKLSMTAHAVVTSKGRVTIPKPVREAVGIRQSDLVEFDVRGGEVVLRRVADHFPARFGAIAPWRRPEDWKRIRQQVAAKVASRGAGIRCGLRGSASRREEP